MAGQIARQHGTQGVQPIIILREGTTRTRGREAQSLNITAAKAVAAAIRTTLGPKGMDKMLVDSLGDVVITNDGATILKEMEIEHPAAKMIVEVAKTMDDEVGDGTTTAVILAGELLKKAEELLEQEIHPTIIAGGYLLAENKSKEILNSMVLPVSIKDEDILLKIAATAIIGKAAETSKTKLSRLAVDAVKAVAEIENGRKVDTGEIKVEKREGGSIEDSELISGMVIDKGRAHPDMPKKVKNAKILLLNAAIEVKKTETKSEIEITSPEQLQYFLDQEETILKNMVKKIIDTGANVVFCQKGIDDLAQHYLAKAGIYACSRVSEKDLEKLGRATGGRSVTSLEAASNFDLGSAGMVEERKIGENEMTFAVECANPKAVSIVIRGGTKHVVENLETTLHDALRVVGVVVEDGRYVAGGGSPEIEVALRLREYASTLKGREQLAVYKFAEAVEVVPRTLAENAGLDPIDMLVEMRSRHEAGEKNAGLNVYRGKVVDMLEEGVVEPLRLKTQALSSATDAANMILRIDDVIAAGKEKLPERPQGMEEY